jgi:hypothetical protein
MVDRAEGFAIARSPASDENIQKIIAECRKERPSWLACHASEYYCEKYMVEAVAPFLRAVINTKPGTGTGPPKDR